MFSSSGRRRPKAASPTATQLSVVSPLRVLLCIVGVVVIGVLSSILTIILRREAGVSSNPRLFQSGTHTSEIAGGNRERTASSSFGHATSKDASAEGLKIGGYARSTGADIEIADSHKHCEMVGIFNKKDRIQSVSQLKVWPLPHQIELYKEEWLLSPQLSWQSNLDSNTLRQAISRYNDLIFPHRINKKKWNGRGSNNVFDTVVIFVQSSDERLQLGFDETYELLVSGETPLLSVDKTTDDDSGADDNDDDDDDDENEEEDKEENREMEDKTQSEQVRRRLLSSGKCRGKIMIKAKTVYGAMRALETLSQLTRFSFTTHNYRVRLGWIQDKPKMPWRGIHLDTSRHFHPVWAIKHLLDAMSYAKFNVFHWHIVDEESFPFESKAFPKLWNGSYSAFERYSTEDLIDVVEFARLRGIRVVPEYDTPGHAGSWCKGYPELCIRAPCRKPSPTLFDPSNPFTFKLINGVLKESHQDRFFDKHVHLGMDEVRFECYDNDQKVKKWLPTEGLSRGKDIYKYWADKLTGYVKNDLKQTSIVWEEVFRNARAGTPKGTIVHIWMGHDWIKQTTQAGYQTLVSSGWYLDHLNTPWQKYYNNDIFKGTSNQAQRNLVLGGEACMWSEHIDLSVLDATVWPKAAAAAENLWSTFTDVDSAFSRLEFYRCNMMHRGVGGGPLKHQQSRVAPNNPHSCYQE